MTKNLFPTSKDHLGGGGGGGGGGGDMLLRPCVMVHTERQSVHEKFILVVS